MSKKLLFLLALSCQLLAISYSANAQYIDRYDFPSSPAVGSLVRIGNKLYGMTSEGGLYGAGNIFSVDTNGAGYTDMYDFSGADGINPYGALTLVGNKFYGTTSSGGLSDGNIFSIDTNGTGFKDLYNFNGSDGDDPTGSLVLAGNKLYGMTYDGGINSDGNIFSIDTNGTGFTNMYNFNGTDGENPSHNLTLVGNKLYGTTPTGGSSFNGNIFSIDTNGTGFNDMHDFTGTDGDDPQSSLTLAGNKLYGTTVDVISGDNGQIFSIDTNGGGFKDIHNFTGGEGGSDPNGYTILLGSNLYGMTEKGGSNNTGIIFAIDTSGMGFTNLYDFTGGTNGTTPYFGLTIALNTSHVYLYGATILGGASGNGNIFSLSGFSVQASVTNNIPCHGEGAVGSAIAFSYLGISPYTYQWNDANSQTTVSATGLTVGNYTVTVTDHAGSTATASVSITQPNALLANASLSSITSNNIGTALASATGGTSPYTYQWNDANSQTTAAANGLTAGNYTVTVTDAHNCAAVTASVSIFTSPTGTAGANFFQENAVQNWTVPAGVTTVTLTAIGAAGGNDGSGFGSGNGALVSGTCTVTPGDVISIAVGSVGEQGGQGPINESAGGGGGGTFLYDSNTHALLIVGAGGGGSDNQSSPGNNGSADVIDTSGGGVGGAANYGGGGGGYNSDGGIGFNSAMGGSGRADGFLGGDDGGGYNSAGGFGGGGEGDVIGGGGGGGGGYNGGFGGGGGYNGGGGGGSYLNGTVVDTISGSNTGVGYASITYQILSVNASVTTNVTTYGGNDGSALASASAGISPYTYQWNDASSQTTAAATGLTVGSYTITVTDASMATATASVTITQPACSGIWLGVTSTDWNDASNWCSGVPTSTVNVIIPSGTPYAPSTNSGTSAVCNNITINSGASLRLATGLTVSGNFSNSGTFTPASNTVTFNAASGTQTLTSGGSSFYAVTFSGAGTLQVTGHALTLINSLDIISGTFDLNGFASTVGDIEGAGTIDNSSAAPVTLSTGSDDASATFSGIIENTGGALSLVDNGTFTLSGANTFSGGVTLSPGTLNINNATALGTGTFSINGGTIDNTSGAPITLSTNNAQTWNGNFTFTGSNDLNMGTGAVTLSANPTMTVTANTITEGGIISGAHSIIKTGTGALTLSGANTYTGGVILLAGQLNINNSTALGTGTFTISGGIIDNTSGGAITMSNNNLQSWSAGFDFRGSNNLDMGTGAVTLFANPTISVNADTLTEGGIISGTHSITKSGAGALTLSGVNTFSLGSILSGGLLNINNASALGTGSFAINNGTTIDNTSGSALTITNPQTWNGSFTFTGTNNLTFTNNVALPSSTTITTNGGNFTENGVINASANSITKQGAGILTLGAANNFIGGITLNAGQLNINNAKALGGAAGGTLTISPTSAVYIDNTSGSPIIMGFAYHEIWGGNFTFIGSNNLSTGTGVITLSANDTVTINAKNLIINGSLAGISENLTTAGAGTFSALQTTGINSLTISSGSTFVATSGILSLFGNFTNNGTFTNNSGTVDFVGNSAQTIGGSTNNTIFNNLIIDNLSGGVSLNTPETVSTNVTLTSGNLILGSNNLTLGSGATISDASGSSYIITNGTGALTQTYNGAATYTFPVGDTSNYSPISLTFTSGTNGGTINVLTSNSKEANIIGSTNYLNRFWTVSESGVDPFSCSVQGTYVTGDVTGAETSISGAEWTGSAFTQFGAVDNIAHQVNATGITTFGDFTGIPLIPPTVTTSVTSNVTCHNSNNGSALASASAGVSPYTYQWNDASSQTTASATGLTAGSYTVTVTDDIGTTATASVSITQPNAPEVLFYGNLPACSGQSNGTAIASCFGGTQPFTYAWFNGNTSSSTGPVLSAGNYTITVTDNCGISTTGTTTIKQNALLGTPSIVSTAIHCNNGTGSLTANFKNGVAPYTYAWSDVSGQTTPTATGLSAGTYTITMHDMCGSSATASSTLGNPAALTKPSIVTTAIHCNGGVGSLTANHSGGTAPYTYLWTDVNAQTTQVATGLTAGTYSVTITDNCGASIVASTTLTNPAALGRPSIVTTAIHCYGGTGSLTANHSGGTAPYTYAWTDANAQTTQVTTGLTAGTYSITITDNCEASATSSANLVQPIAVVPTISHQDCSDGGEATVKASGGTTPYTYDWERLGVEGPSDVNTATITGIANTNYVEVTTDKYGCSGSVSVFVSCTLGPDKENNNNTTHNTNITNVVLYPNPTTGIINLEVDNLQGVMNNEEAQVEIYNMTGEKIQELAIVNSTLSIDLSTQANGIYLMRITDKEGNLISEKKIIKAN